MKHLLVGHLSTPQSYRAGSVLDHSGGCDRCLAGGDFASPGVVRFYSKDISL